MSKPASAKPKLIWHSNAPFTGTGYGSQTGLFTPLLTETYDLIISSFYGLQGARLNYNGVDVVPGIDRDWGDDSLPMHAEDFFGDLRGGLVVSLMDVWVLDPLKMRRLDLACWVPIDHEPTPQVISRFFAESGAIPIAMSRFGQRQLADFDPLYVPHAVRTEVFKPLDRAKCAEATHIPTDKFVVGMVAANKGNPSRKAFSEALQAFKTFHDQHPDSVLYLHTELSGRIDGVHIPSLIDACGLGRDAVIFANQYRIVVSPFSESTLAKIYNSMDVLLAASCGEGFGVPVIEAQACGVPVIVTDFSAQPELVGAGWTVDYSKYYTPQNSWQAHPDVPDMVDALNRAYAARERRETMSIKAVAHASQYSLPHVLKEHMLPALEEARRRLIARRPTPLKVAA